MWLAGRDGAASACLFILALTFMMMLQGTWAFEMFMSGNASGSNVFMLQSVMTPLSSRLEQVRRRNGSGVKGGG
jgi:hypothetical protein